MKCTEEFSGLPTLRTHWYDASKDALFTEQHKRIGMISGVKVRLGRMSFSGEQKGVDLKLGLDLVGLARNRAAGTVFLLSGDDDLAEAVEAAQDFGIKVVLVGLEDSGHRLGVASVAEHLALRVDSIITLPTDLVTKCFTKQAKAEPLATNAAGTPVASIAAPATVMAGVPEDLVRPKPPLAPRPGPVPVRAVRIEVSQLVYSSATRGQTIAVEPSPMVIAGEVGGAVAESW